MIIDMVETSDGEWLRVNRKSEFTPLLGEPCVNCGQPALYFVIRWQRIKHVDLSLSDCDAGAR